tara:strand:- start:1522 stop:1737 length:216 start_codon:yes stop_codon:yes gene_type:complete
MLAIEITARQWGSSLGIALPKTIVKKANIKPNTPVKIFIQEKKVDLSKVFGTAKFKQSTQALLDEARQGED